jgi:TP901 family phage tail tape measure protein
MAFERVGLGGKLTFEEAQAVASLRRATQSFDSLLKSATQAQPPVTSFGQRFRQAGAQVRRGTQMMQSGMGQVTGGARNLAMGLAPVSLAMGIGISKAAGFEQKMSGVAAITRASADELAAMTAEAKRQGIVSVFSASQSAEAMENLGRAGFSTSEILTGLGGVMAAAAAEGVDLATSSDIIARVVRGMGEEVSQANHIADILALTSAKSNTSIVDLGESFKYGATQAKIMGISTEETAAVFGKLADAGLRGSVGGTAFTNMLVKISKPSKEAARQMEEWGISLTDSTGAMRPLSNIISQFDSRLSKIRDTTERARIQTELFGIRGAKAYGSLALAGGEAIDSLTQDLRESSFGVGAAQEAAQKRLDNFLGALTLFGSSVEAVSIEFFGPLLKSFQAATEGMTQGMNKVLLSVQALKQNQESYATVAARIAKDQGAALAKEDKLVQGLTEREQGRAAAQIKALTQTAIISKTNTATEQKSRRDTLAGMLAQQASLHGLSDAERQLHADRIAHAIERTAAQQKIEVEARALLENEKRLADIEAEHGTTARIMAEGVLDAIAKIKDAFQSAVDVVKDFGEWLKNSIGEEQLKNLVSLATRIVVVGGVLVPVIAGVGLFSILAAGAITPLVGLGKVVAGLATSLFGLAKGFIAMLPVIWPIVAIGAVLAGAFMLIRKEGESVGETFRRVWGVIKEGAINVWQGSIKPFLDQIMLGFTSMAEGLKEIWMALWVPISELASLALAHITAALRPPFEALGMMVNEAIDWWQELFTAGAEVATDWGSAISGFVDSALETMGMFADWMVSLAEPLRAPFMALQEFLGTFADWVLSLFETKIGKGIAKVFNGLVGVVSAPFKLVQSLMGESGGPPKVTEKTVDVIEKGSDKVAKVVPSPAAKHRPELAQAILRQRALMRQEEQAARQQAAERELKANVQIEDNRKIEVRSKMCVDGEGLSIAKARHEQSVFERSGGRTTPFVRRRATESGMRVAATARA